MFIKILNILKTKKIKNFVYLEFKKCIIKKFLFVETFNQKFIYFFLLYKKKHKVVLENHKLSNYIIIMLNYLIYLIKSIL